MMQITILREAEVELWEAVKRWGQTCNGLWGTFTTKGTKTGGIIPMWSVLMSKVQSPYP